MCASLMFFCRLTEATVNKGFFRRAALPMFAFDRAMVCLFFEAFEVIKRCHIFAFPGTLSYWHYPVLRRHTQPKGPSPPPPHHQCWRSVP